MTHASYDELRRVIHGVRRRWRLKIALRGAALLVAAGLLTFAVSAYAMDHFRYEPWAVHAFRIFAYVTLVGLAVRLLVVPLWNRVSEDRVALYVEEHEPTLQAAVLSAVGVGGRETPDKEVSRALVERLIEDAVRKCQTIDYGRHVERQGLRRASGLLAAAAALGMAVTILSPAFMRHAAPFLFAPWNVRAANPYAIEVDPGNTTVARGGSQPVTARLKGFESEKVELSVRSGPTGDWKRWPMTTEPGMDGFRFVLFALDAPTDYFVEAAGVRSPSFHLDVADIPYVKRVDLEYRFPAYTGLPPQTVADTGDVAALAGTEVVVHVTPTMKVPGGRLQVEGEEARSLTAAEDGTLVASFPVQKDGFYRIAFPGRDGKMAPGSPDFTIDVLADQPPSVTFLKPGRDAKVTSIEEVFTEMRAEDDYGVARAELVYSVNGGPQKTVVLHQGRGKKSVSAGHTFFLEELSLEPGDFISYFGRAGDESAAHQTTTTDIYFMEVRPFSKEYKQAEERGAKGAPGGDNGGALSYQQRQIIAATFKIVRDRRAADKQTGEDLATLALMQGRLHDQVQSLIQRMANRGVVEPGSGFAKTSDSLRAAQVEMASARGQLQARKAKDALTPEQGALKHLQRAEAAFREVQVSFGNEGEGGGNSAMNAEELADLFELELDKLKNQYETVQRGQQQQADDQVDAALERLRELAQRQEQEAERMRRQSGGPPNMGGGGGGSQRQLAEQTEELARRLERLAREKSNPAMEETARRLKEAANAMRRSSTGGQGTGEADAKAALDRLRDARKRLENERTGRLDRDVQQAQREAEEMRQAQEKIAGEAEQEMGSRASGGGSTAESGRLERLLERKDALGDQVAGLENQLDRMARDARATNKDAARKLQEAADGIRDRKVRDKIRYSKGVVKSGAADQARQLEAEIGTDLGNLQRKLGEAAGAASASGEDKRMAALERMRGLVRGLESVEERLREQQGQQGQQGQRSQQGQQGQQGQEGRQGQQGQQGQQAGAQGGREASQGREGASDGGAQSASGYSGGRPGPASRPDEARQLQRELRERAREAEALGRELREGRPGDRGAAAGLDSALREMRRFEDPRVYGEPRGLAELVASVVQGLKAAEFAMRREVEGPDREKLFLSGTQDLPPGWQALVEEYYRSLSRKPGAGSPPSK